MINTSAATADLFVRFTPEIKDLGITSQTKISEFIQRKLAEKMEHRLHAQVEHFEIAELKFEKLRELNLSVMKDKASNNHNPHRVK